MAIVLVVMGLTWLFIFFARLGMNKQIRNFEGPAKQGNVVDISQYRNKQ